MDMQKTFNRMYEHINAQGPCVEENNQCLYRSAEGASCAIGVLLSDDEYHSDMEAKGFLTLAEDSNLLPAWMTDNTQIIAFLAEAQSAHDMSVGRCPDRRKFPAKFQLAMRRLADKHDLSMPDS